MRKDVWRRLGATRRGRSHRKESIPCQDSVARLRRRNVNVIALADGAGSAELSHLGSAACARELCSLFCRNFDSIWKMDESSLGGKLVTALKDKLVSVARSRSCDVHALASTCLVVAVKKNRYIAAHLGDGVIGVELVGPGNACVTETLSSPDNGEHSNETTFVTSADASEHMRVYKGLIGQGRRKVTGFILMSDGPEAALYRKSDGQLAPACSKLLQGLRKFKGRSMERELDGVLKLIGSSKTFDDCSIALMSHV